MALLERPRGSAHRHSDPPLRHHRRRQCPGTARHSPARVSYPRRERAAAMALLEQIPGDHRATVGADKYDTRDFVAECRHLKVTPHNAQNTKRSGGSAIDDRTIRHDGYEVSQKKRKRIEECFGSLKTIALMRTCERTPNGRIRRSSSARHAFRELHPCPATGAKAGPCPGYLVDHIVPLKPAGATPQITCSGRVRRKRRPRIEWNRIWRLAGSRRRIQWQMCRPFA